MKQRMSLTRLTSWVISNPEKTIIFISLATLFFFLLIPRISFKADMKDMVPLDASIKISF